MDLSRTHFHAVNAGSVVYRMLRLTPPRVRMVAPLFAGAVFVGVISLVGTGAQAATFTVTKTLDSRDGTCDSDCSLREAVIAANARPGPDTIMIRAGTYVFQQAGQEEDNAAFGDLDLYDNLTIRGSGQEVTVIDGNEIDRVFEIQGLHGIEWVQSGVVSAGKRPGTRV